MKTTKHWYDKPFKLCINIATWILIILVFGLHVLFGYYILEIFNSSSISTSYFTTMLGAVGFTGTIAGLSLRLSSCNPSLKKQFYAVGKWLVFCSVLFIVAVGLQYIYTIIGNSDDSICMPKFITYLFEDRDQRKNLFKLIISWVGVVVFFGAIFVSFISFCRLILLIPKEYSDNPENK